MLQRSKSRFLTFILIFILSMSGAFAGDRALLEVIGYSNDGRYFAFEEYGIQDGSGFAYASIFIVDIEEDRWVVGTPIRQIAEEDIQPLHAVRAAARADAVARLEDLAINRPAHVLAFIGDGAADTDGLTLDFGRPGFADSNGILNQHTATLEIFKTPSAAPCMDWFGEKPMGFALRISGEGTNFEAHRDDNLPRSRNCPITYQIAGVYMPFQAFDLSRAVALISVYAYGFEGPDRRFIAVPVPIER